MVDDLDALYATAAFGQQIEQFVASDIGQYLIAKAQSEASEAAELLADCDPFNSENIIKLQGTIRRAEGFRRWLLEGVNDGLSAIQIIEERNNG